MSEPLILDNTTLSNIRACHRKGYYFKERSLRKPFVPSALNFGAVIHAAAAHFLKELALRPERKEEAKEEAIAIALKSWREVELSEKEWRTPDKAVELLDAWFRDFDLLPVLAPDGKPLVEVDFAFPLLTLSDGGDIQQLLKDAGYEPMIIYTGIIDLITHYMGQLYILDHKTCSYHYRRPAGSPTASIDSAFWNQFMPHAASGGYIWGGSRYLAEPIQGMLINAIGIGRAASSPFCFAKQTFLWTPEMVEEWRQDTLAIIKLWLVSKAQGHFPRNPDACQLFNSPCPYWNLCKYPASTRENLESSYIIEEWNPLKVRENEAKQLGEA